MLEQHFIDLVDEDNTCFECSDVHTTFASVSLCVLLCEKCAMKHRQLGMHISYIKPLNDQWSDPTLKNMLKGGNKRLRHFMESYGMGNELEMERKYDSRAMEYYRLMLRAEIDGRDIPMRKPTLLEALEPYFEKKLKSETSILDEKWGLLGSMSCFLSSATSRIAHTAEGMYHKSLDVSSSLWNTLPEFNKYTSATLDIFHSAADLAFSSTLKFPDSSKVPTESYEMKEFYKEAEELDYFSGIDLEKSMTISAETQSSIDD